MRVRTLDRPRKFSGLTATVQGEKPDGSLVQTEKWTGGAGLSSLDLKHIIDEELQPGQRIDKSRTHYVDHLVINGNVQRKSFTFNVGQSAPYVKTHVSFTDVDITDYAWPILPSDSSIAIACDEALRFFAAGCTKEEVSIPLFLWEAGEVKRLVQQIVHLFEKKPAARLSLPIAEEFGVSPVIRDIQNTVDALLKVADRLKWMRENDGKPVKVRFTKELPTAAILSSAIPYYSSHNWHKQFRKSYCKFRAHARIRYNVRYLGDAEIRIRMILQSLGFLNPLKVVWDHIPFSFLVDKLLDIGSLLERFSMPFVFQHHVEDMGYSIKVEETYRWYYTLRGEAKLVSETNKVFYRRRRGLALTFQSPAFSDPSVDALAYGLRFLSLAKI